MNVSKGVEGIARLVAGIAPPLDDVGTISPLDITPSSNTQSFSKNLGYNPVTVMGDDQLIPNNIIEGHTIFNVSGSAREFIAPDSLTVRAAPTDQVFSRSNGGYSPVTVSGENHAIPSNIREGVNICGVQGTLAPFNPDPPLVIHPTKESQSHNSANGWSDVSVDGDSNLIPGNIKQDVSIFGVVGTYNGEKPTNVVRSMTANQITCLALSVATQATTLSYRSRVRAYKITGRKVYAQNNTYIVDIGEYIPNISVPRNSWVAYGVSSTGSPTTWSYGETIPIGSFICFIGGTDSAGQEYILINSGGLPLVGYCGYINYPIASPSNAEEVDYEINNTWNMQYLMGCYQIDTSLESLTIPVNCLYYSIR